MPSLILDTSTERGIVAIAQDEQVLFFKELPFGFLNSQWLLPEVQNGLQDNGLRTCDLNWVAVGIGPGSYTGIRVGAIAAKSLAFACNIPLVGVCALEGFVPEEDATFAAVIDAKIGGAYLQKGTMQGGQVKFTGGPELYPLLEAAEILQDVGIIVTPNAALIRPKLEAIFPKNAWKWLERYPSAVQFARIAREKVVNKQYSTDGHLDLLYLRKTQAEIEKENCRKQGYGG